MNKKLIVGAIAIGALYYFYTKKQFIFAPRRAVVGQGAQAQNNVSRAVGGAQQDVTAATGALSSIGQAGGLSGLFGNLFGSSARSAPNPAPAAAVPAGTQVAQSGAAIPAGQTTGSGTAFSNLSSNLST